MERTHIRELRCAAPPTLCSARLNAPVHQRTIQRWALSTERLHDPMAYPPGTSIRSACICSHHHRRKSAHYLGVCMRRQNVMLPKFLIKLFENIKYYSKNIISKKKCSSQRNSSEYKTKFCENKMKCSKNKEKWSRTIFKYFLNIDKCDLVSKISM